MTTEPKTNAPSRDHEFVPFWKWDWKSHSKWTKAALLYRVVVKPVLWLSAAIAASAIILQSVSSWNAEVRWREAVYQDLEIIHAGYQRDYVIELLGTPALSKGIANGSREDVWVGRDREYFVQTASDSTGQVTFFGVTSCSAKFTPRFNAFEGTVIDLQKAALDDSASISDDFVARQEPGLQEKIRQSASEQAKERSVDYMAGSTGSTPERYLEFWMPSNASLQRTYFVGISAACLDPMKGPKMKTAGETYNGTLEDMPDYFKDFRETTAANVYAETSPSVDPTLDDAGNIRSLGISVGVRSFDLPPGLAEDGETLTVERN